MADRKDEAPDWPQPYAAICAQPFADWRLDKVEFQEGKHCPDLWAVTLKRVAFGSWLTRYVTAMSDEGPLEAWREALDMAKRDERRREEASGRAG